MANYDLMVDSTFTPFSFQDIAAPYLMYKQEYDKRLEDLGALDEAASIWDGLTDAEKDPIAHAKYTAYINALQQAADGLAREGLNGLSKSHLIALKGNYNKRIKPIETAFLKRAQQIEAQAKAGNSQLNSYDATNTSLDDYLLDPTLQYKSIDLNKLGQEAAAYMGVISKQITDYSLTKDPKIADNMKKLFTKQLGYTEAQANQLMSDISSGNVDTNTIVGNIAQRLYNETGVSDNNIWNDDARSSVWNTIAKGAIATIGGKDLQLVDDKSAEMALKYQQDLSLMREKYAIDNGYSSWDQMQQSQRQSAIDGNFSGNTYYDFNDASHKYNQALEAMKKIDSTGVSYFGKDGNADIMFLHDEFNRKFHGIEDFENISTFHRTKSATIKYTNKYKELVKKYPKYFTSTGNPYAVEALKQANKGKDAFTTYSTAIGGISDTMKKSLEYASMMMFRDKYGVTRTISDNVYNMIKDVKNSDIDTTGKLNSYEGLENVLQNTSRAMSSYSINMKKYDRVTKDVVGGLSDKIESGNKTTAYKLTSDGKRGESVKLNELLGSRGSNGNYDRTIRSISYMKPTKYNGFKLNDNDDNPYLIISFNETDGEYIIPADAIINSNTLVNTMKYAESINAPSNIITEKIRLILDNYNKNENS